LFARAHPAHRWLESLAARHHQHQTEAVVVVAIAGLIVIPVRRQQIAAVVVVPATTPKHAVASYRTAAFSGVCAVIPHGFNLPAKLKKFSDRFAALLFSLPCLICTSRFMVFEKG